MSFPTRVPVRRGAPGSVAPRRPGHHKLVATSGSGVVHEVDIEMPGAGTRWALLDYWYDPDGRREFTFSFHDEPVASG